MPWKVLAYKSRRTAASWYKKRFYFLSTVFIPNVKSPTMSSEAGHGSHINSVECYLVQVQILNIGTGTLCFYRDPFVERLQASPRQPPSHLYCCTVPTLITVNNTLSRQVKIMLSPLNTSMGFANSCIQLTFQLNKREIFCLNQ